MYTKIYLVQNGHDIYLHLGELADKTTRISEQNMCL